MPAHRKLYRTCASVVQLIRNKINFRFKLITTIEQPHSDLVTSMQFCPIFEEDIGLDEFCLVTTSLDGKSRIWTPEESKIVDNLKGFKQN